MTSTLSDDLTGGLNLDAWAARYCMTDIGDWQRKQALVTLLGEVASVFHKLAVHSRDPLALGLEDPIDQLNNIRCDLQGIDTEPDDAHEGMRERLADRNWYHAGLL